jgi:biopolymer transport protein ExbD
MIPRTPRRIRKKRGQLPEITLTPLIDTALVLLVIFMVATPVIHNSIKVDLPQGNTKEGEISNDNEKELVIYIDKNKNIFFQDKPIQSQELMVALQQALQNRSKRYVVVNGDQSIPYGFLVELVDRIKYVGGVEHVLLATEKGAN